MEGAKKHPHQHQAGKELLQNKQASDLFPPQRRKLVFVCKNDPITQAFKLIIDNGILSVPVYDVSAHSYMGFVDMLDLVAHVVKVLGRDSFKGGDTDFDALLESSAKFGQALVSDITDLSRRNPYFPVDESAPLMSVVKLFARHKVHRLPVVNKEGELLTIITQSHLVRLFNQSIHLFAPCSSQTVKELSLGYTKVESLSASALAFDAFVLMHEKGLSAVAVTDDQGNLIGNISNSDLKVIGYSGKLINNLLLTVSEFMLLLPENPAISGPIAVTPEATLEEVITKLEVCRVHRVYVVDGGKPIGVITGLEVINAILSMFP